MATRQQIGRLAQRIEALAIRKTSAKVVRIIVDCESEVTTRERHYLAHPEDRGVEILFIMRVIVDPIRTNDPQLERSRPWLQEHR